MSSSKVTCCIRGCSNMPYKNNTQVKFYRFPESSLNTAWITFKRQKWVNAVKNHVKHQKDWEPNKNTRICSAHFINNQKSEHPLHPSYIPTIFPGKKNTKNNIQLVQRFERLQQRKSRTNIINNTIPNNKNNNNGLDTSNKTVIAADEDQNSSEIEPQNIETCHVSNIVLQAASRSVICQTEKLISESILDKHTYFFCNIHTSDGVSTAEVQVNLPIKKTSEKMCQVNFPTLRKPIKDMGCDLISQGSR